VGYTHITGRHIGGDTDITSDMCIPGGDTQNTEALHPGLKLLQGKHGGHEGHQTAIAVSDMCIPGYRALFVNLKSIIHLPAIYKLC